MSLPKNVFKSARVLIVDDEPMNTDALTRILNKVGGFHVQAENDSREALTAFELFHPDILLLDLGMPHFDGFAVMEQIRSTMSADTYFPIVVLTGDLEPDTRLRALSVGAKDFLNKPLDAAEVLLRIRNLLETRFLHLEMQGHNVLLEESIRERTEQLEITLERLHTTQNQVIKQERLGALGVMASGIAHDFNNSLATILGFSELLLDQPGRTEYLRTIMTAAQDARQTVRRLSEFYKSDRSGDPHAALSLNALAEHAVSLTMPRWSNQALSAGIRIVVKTDLAPALPLVAGNPAELREALTNLIFNAVDALPKGGTICVKTRAEEHASIIEVKDNGTGMNARTRERCLEPFFTTKGDGGTGLGLSVVHGIVQRHAGSVEIESEPDAGTTFTLRFPATSSVNAPEQPLVSAGLERALHILIIDDQPIICELVAELLRTDGHAVDTVGSGGAALERFRQKDYDLFITDLAMPGMTGEQLADVIKQLTPNKPVILLTGFGDVLKEAGRCTPSIDLVVNKPAALTDLRRAIFDVMTRVPRELVAAA